MWGIDRLCGARRLALEYGQPQSAPIVSLHTASHCVTLCHSVSHCVALNNSHCSAPAYFVIWGAFKLLPPVKNTLYVHSYCYAMPQRLPEYGQGQFSLQFFHRPAPAGNNLEVLTIMMTMMIIIIIIIIIIITIIMIFVPAPRPRWQ